MDEEKVNKVYIYGLYDTIDKRIFYVGMTKDLERRLYLHIRDGKLNRKSKKKSEYIAELLSRGVLPEIVTLEEVTETNWQQREIYHIAQYDNLTNSAPGGGAYPDVWKGRKHTEETKRKMSERSKGKVFSAETIQKMKYAKRLKGYFFDRHGVPCKFKKTVYKYDLQGNYICEYESTDHAARETNNVQSSIVRNCNNAIHRVKDNIFSYTKANKVECYHPPKYYRDLSMLKRYYADVM